jgi:hypothetical protein
MNWLTPYRQLVLCLVLAGVGLVLFFSGEFRNLGLPLGWFGLSLFIAAVWFCVDAVYRIPTSDAESAVAPGEWQAWIGVAFLGAVVVANFITLPAFAKHLPIGLNPEAGVAGRGVGMLLLSWWILAHVLERRWVGKVLVDERDRAIERIASIWARRAITIGVFAISLWLGFHNTEQLRQTSHPYIAQLLVTVLACGFWVDELVAAVLYWRDRRGAV